MGLCNSADETRVVTGSTDSKIRMFDTSEFRLETKTI